MSTKVIEIIEKFPRNAYGIACECGGYADKVDCTKEEIKKYNCNNGRECCARAFLCRICKTRIVGKAEAPEME